MRRDVDRPVTRTYLISPLYHQDYNPNPYSAE